MGELLDAPDSSPPNERHSRGYERLLLLDAAETSAAQRLAGRLEQSVFEIAG